MDRIIPIQPACAVTVQAILDVVKTQCAAGNCMYGYVLAPDNSSVTLKFKACDSAAVALPPAQG